MSEVFISYAHGDRDKATLISELLTKQGFLVWWDKDIAAGIKFDKVIEAKLKAASAVIVLWSRRSAESDWVRAEADAAAFNKTMIPVRIENVELPLSHRLANTLDFTQWDRSAEAHEFRQLVAAVERGCLASLSNFLAAAIDRAKGAARVASRLAAIAAAGVKCSDFAKLELAYHEFARLGDLKAVPIIRNLAQNVHDTFSAKAFGLLQAMCHLAAGELEEARNCVKTSRDVQLMSDAQRVVMSLHAIFVYGALEDQEALDDAWQTLAGMQQEKAEQNYPLVTVQKRFDRALISVIYSRDNVEELVSSLPIAEYRGLAHLAAANSRAVRKSPFILKRIERTAKLKEWKHITEVTALRRRCRSFEKLLLPIAGTLFGTERHYG